MEPNERLILAFALVATALFVLYHMHRNSAAGTIEVAVPLPDAIGKTTAPADDYVPITRSNIPPCLNPCPPYNPVTTVP